MTCKKISGLYVCCETRRRGDQDHHILYMTPKSLIDLLLWVCDCRRAPSVNFIFSGTTGPIFTKFGNVASVWYCRETGNSIFYDSLPQGQIILGKNVKFVYLKNKSFVLLLGTYEAHWIYNNDITKEGLPKL